MRKYSDSKVNKVFTMLLVIIAIFALLFIVIRNELNKHITEICEYKSKETANAIISYAINDELKGSNDTDYIVIKRNKSDEIISIESNTNSINQLQTDLRAKTSEALRRIENVKTYIPLGTLTGINVFGGRGPDVSLKFHQVGVADTKLLSKFTSAGINQTRHRMVLRVTIELSAILPLHSRNIKVSDDYIISETIIVGKVPKGLISTNML